MESQLYLNDQLIDLSEDTGIDLTIQLADIRYPDKRQASYSKTIHLPGSKQNNKVLKFYHEITNDSNFNPTLKSTALLLQNGVQVFRGFFQLLKVNKNPDGEITYEGCVFSDTKNLFTEMGDYFVVGNSTSGNNISFDDLNYINTVPNIEATWTNTSGVVVPLIDYGFTTDGREFPIKSLYPAVFAKTIFDRIFNKYGYTYNSDFLNSELFGKLICPWVGTRPQMIKSDYDNFAAAAGIVSSTGNVTTSGATIPAHFTTPFNDLSSPYYDVGGNFNTTTHSYLMQSITRDYIITSKYVWSVTITSLNGTPIPGIGTQIPVSIGASVNGGASIDPTSTTITIPAGSYTTGQSRTFIQSDLNYSADLTSTPGASLTMRVDIGNLDSVMLNFKVTINTLVGSTFDIIPSFDACENDTIVVSQGIDPKMKQADFIRSIVSMFNLYVDVDRYNPKLLNIEPRDNFYASGTQVDWSNKIDYAQPHSFTPLSEDSFKQLDFRYQEDDDLYNRLYQYDFKEPYGSQRLISTNQFITNKNSVEIYFAPTPLVRQYSTSIPICPAIYQQEGSGDKKQFNAKCRLLFYGGLNTSRSFRIRAESVTVDPSEYPYCGNLDDVDNPTIDLNFGIPKKIYYLSGDPIPLTNNTLYNKYYSKYARQISDKNSKVFTAYFNLSEMDILNVDFRNKIFIRDANYYINKIINYDAVGNNLTQVELIFFNEVSDFSPVVTNYNRGAELSPPVETGTAFFTNSSILQLK